MMQAPTHMLTGILLLEVFKVIFPAAPLWVQILVVFPLSFASHFFIDASSIITYHPPKSDWKDWFWVSYHLLVYAGTIIVAVFFFMEFWWTMIAATLVDLSLITPSFTEADLTPYYFGCILGEGVEWVRRFPISGEGFLIKIEHSPSVEI